MKIKNFLKEYGLVLFLIIFILVDICVTLPYTVYTGGGTIDICSKLQDKKHDCNNLHSTYVNVLEGKITNVLLGLVIPGWDIVSNDDIKMEDEEIEAANKRERIMLYEANSAATYVAYKKANEKLEITREHYYITYITNKAHSDLKVGDEIISINDKEVNSIEEINSIIINNKADTLKIKVLRNNIKIDTISNYYIDENNERKIGIVIEKTYDYKDAIKYDFENNEAGSSGGLMIGLAMYNSLIEDDITNNHKICGTGTIDYDGNIGEIGGVKYKIAGAEKKQCAYFLVPTNNLEEAQNVVKEKNYNIKLIEAINFDQILNQLKTLN